MPDIDTDTDTDTETQTEPDPERTAGADGTAGTARRVETDGRTRTDDADSPPAERHGARAALYGTLACAFCYPDERTVRELLAPETETGLRAAGATLGYDERVDTLCAALAGADARGLESAHTDLFGLPDGEGYPVVPYEAEHTIQGDIGRKQRRIATVAGLLEALDLEVAADFHERPDHVAVELEVMQVLAARRAVAIDEGDREAAADLERAEATVLDEHLVDFVPSFVADLRAASDRPVYVAAADLAERLVADDAAAHPEPRSTDASPGAPTGGVGR